MFAFLRQVGKAHQCVDTESSTAKKRQDQPFQAEPLPERQALSAPASNCPTLNWLTT